MDEEDKKGLKDFVVNRLKRTKFSQSTINRICLYLILLIWCLICIFSPATGVLLPFIFILLHSLWQKYISAIPDIYTYLSRIQPVTWALTYLLCIPFFALIYHLLFPNSFTYSTLNIDEVVWEKKVMKELQTSLTNDVWLNIYQINETDSLRKGNKIEYNGYTINHKFIPLDKIEKYVQDDPIVLAKYDIPVTLFDSTVIENDSIKMLIAISIENTIPVFIRLTAKLPDEEYFKRNYWNFSSYSSLPTDVEKFATLFHAVDNKKREQSELQKITPLLQKIYTKCYQNMLISDNTKQILRRINFHKMGYKQEVGNNFLRMFYFSAITLTTTGFGDILPITDDARIVVAIEAIFGIILIGLFLNSLSNKFYQNNKIDQSE